MFYSAAKFGCWQAGCCRARVNLARIHELAFLEAVISGTLGICLAAAVIWGGFGYAIPLIGSLAIIALRGVSLVLQARPALGEIGVTVLLIGVLFAEATAKI
jgi:hypothetical protein